MRVDLQCGLTNDIVDVKENGKCNYEFIFQTPSVCSASFAKSLQELIWRHVGTTTTEEQVTPFFLFYSLVD